MVLADPSDLGHGKNNFNTLPTDEMFEGQCFAILAMFYCNTSFQNPVFFQPPHFRLLYVPLRVFVAGPSMLNSGCGPYGAPLS